MLNKYTTFNISFYIQRCTYIHMCVRVCVFVYIQSCLSPLLVIPRVAFRIVSAPASFLRFACLRFLLFNLCFTISPVCLLPLSSLHSSLDFCLHFPSSFPIACSFYIPSSPLPFFSPLLPLVCLPLSALIPESLLRALYPPPHHPLSTFLPVCPGISKHPQPPPVCFPTALTPFCLPSSSFCDLRRGQI